MARGHGTAPLPCRGGRSLQVAKRLGIVVFHPAAAHLARPQGQAVHQHGAPAVFRRDSLDLLAPQPGLGALVSQGQLLPVFAHSAKGHEQVMVGREAALLDPPQRHAAAGNAQFPAPLLPAPGRQEQPLPRRLGLLAFQRREDMWARIDRRVDEMMKAGLVEEVRALLQSGVPQRCTAMQAIGYKEMAAALLGDGDTAAAAEEIKLRSRQYAKRQLTWFRRNGAAKRLCWDDTPDFAAALQTSTGYLKEFGI